MSDWEKHYIVGDGKRKKQSKTPTPPPIKRKRSWKAWLILSIIFFLTGLLLGFEEDYQWDEVKDRVEETLKGKGQREVWTRAILKYERIYSYHFTCRLECRYIQLQEVISSLKPENVLEKSEYVNEQDSQKHRIGDIKYTITAKDPASGKLLKTVFSVNTRKRTVTFITAIDLRFTQNNDPCGDNSCQRRENEML